MPKFVLSVFCFVCALNSTPLTAAKRSHARPAEQTIVIFEGVVDAKSAERLTTLISANTDKIIGLKLIVEASTDDDNRYYSSLSDNQLNITSGNPIDSPIEVLINDGVGTTTAGESYTADGFYLI